MPRRILPNTDKVRYEILKTSVAKLNAMERSERFLSKEQYQNLLFAMSRFEQIFLSLQKLKSDPEFLEVQKKAGMFMQHYLTVLQMAVMREELPEDSLAYYGLESCYDKIPAFNTAKQILTWGERLFDGDQKRIANGGKYITNPGIAVVKVWYEKFKSSYQNHKVQLEKFKNNQAFLEKLRHEANQAIAELFNEVEYTYNHLPPEEFRKIASEFGLFYKYSDKEMTEENQPKTSPLFEMETIPIEKIRNKPRRKLKLHKHCVTEALQTEFSFTLKEIDTDDYK